MSSDACLDQFIYSIVASTDYNFLQCWYSPATVPLEFKNILESHLSLNFIPMG